jgi:uncharacterized membrane protein
VHWVPASPFWPIDSQLAHERVVDYAQAHDLALGGPRRLVRGRRYTYAWATLFAIPYLAFVVTELLVNPQARWVAGLSLLLVFAWFCTMILFLRASRVHRE